MRPLFVVSALAAGAWLMVASADQDGGLPPSFPQGQAAKLLAAAAKDPSIGGDFEGLWTAHRVINTTLPPLPTRTVNDRPGRMLSKGRLVIVFALSTCPGSVDQVKSLMRNGWKHPFAKEVIVLIEPGFWAEYKTLVPGISARNRHVELIETPLPGGLAELGRHTPFSLLVDDGRVLAVHLGPESNQFGAWQWPASELQNEERKGASQH